VRILGEIQSSGVLSPSQTNFASEGGSFSGTYWFEYGGEQIKGTLSDSKPNQPRSITFQWHDKFGTTIGRFSNSLLKNIKVEKYKVSGEGLALADLPRDATEPDELTNRCGKTKYLIALLLQNFKLFDPPRVSQAFPKVNGGWAAHPPHEPEEA